MALFHLSVTQTKRSAGQSAIASAAYRAGERLYSEYYGEYSDYTRKGGVICSDILLPSHAPPEYADRQTLWNAVEKAERGKNAQLAYSFDIALQNEFSLEENIALARQFLLENFVSRGMVVDFAVHQPDREDGGIPNPHFHVLCPIRPIEQNGKWGLMCHSEGLYQIDLLNGSKERITEREYWAQKKGQAALDRANAPMIADGITPRQTKFETDKAKLRRTIREALAAASGFDEFAALLLRHGVTVKESRGRLSYLTPDRTKPITARKLGDDFDRAAVLSVLEQNAARAAEKPAAIAEYPGSIKDRLRTKKEAKNAPNNDTVQRMVDIAAKRAEGKGRGYEKWATMHNLKQMSATLMLYQQYGFSSPDELDAAISAANTATQESLAGLKGLEAAIREKKELQRNLLGYIGTKPARDGLKAQKSEKARRAYREQHESDFIIADTAARYFREHGITKLPASKALQREIEQLTVQKNAGYNDYREKRQRAQELQTVRRNIDQILRGAPSQQKKHEQER